MTQYYYLVSSLPFLFPDDAPPFNSDSWLEICREQVSAADHRLLSRIGFNRLETEPEDHSVWRMYSSWETALRNELALQRAQKLNVNPDPFLRGAPFFTSVPQQVKEALAAGSPKATETALDHLRWSQLDAQEAGTQFDLGRLIIYRLKLLLLERRSLFGLEPGIESFRENYTQILDGAVAWTKDAPRPFDTEKRHD